MECGSIGGTDVGGRANGSLVIASCICVLCAVSAVSRRCRGMGFVGGVDVEEWSVGATNVGGRENVRLVTTSCFCVFCAVLVVIRLGCVGGMGLVWWGGG